MRIGERVIAPMLDTAVRDGNSGPARFGKSEINRAAIVAESGIDDARLGRAAISEANLRVAVSPGNRANVADSSHESTFSRASAERTLSTIPSLSSPIGANRKGSNSEPKKDNELEPFMLITGCGGLYRSVRTDPEGVELGTVPGLIDQAGQLSGDDHAAETASCHQVLSRLADCGLDLTM